MTLLIVAVISRVAPPHLAMGLRCLTAILNTNREKMLRRPINPSELKSPHIGGDEKANRDDRCIYTNLSSFQPVTKFPVS